MKYRDVFQIDLNIENCMTNRASLQVLKKGEIYIRDLCCFDIGLFCFLQMINYPDEFFSSM